MVLLGAVCMNAYWYYVVFTVVSFLSIIIRYVGFDLISEDMLLAFLPWFQIMKEGGGLSSLSSQVGDYGLLFQTIIAMLTYIDEKPVYLYKILSITFDFLIAFSISFFIISYKKEYAVTKFDVNKLFCLTYTSVILLPSVVLNSAFWGQNDSIYTFFLLWSIWLLYKCSYKFSFFMLGMALSFKFQSVLLFPLFVFYYFSRKAFSLLNILIMACTFWLSGIIVYFYRGYYLDGFGIYTNQVVMFKRLWINIPSFWALTSADYKTFYLVAIILTFLLLSVVFYMVLSSRLRMDSFEQILGLAVLIEWICILFLPAMHERYTYVMDLMLVMLVFINKQYIIHALIAVIVSYLTYYNYLFLDKGINPVLVLVYLITWIHFSYTLVCSENKSQDNYFKKIINHEVQSKAAKK